MVSQFIWYELLTGDPDAAAGFYGAVLGWTAKDSGQPGKRYLMLSKDDVAVGGLMAIPADAANAGMRPAWLGYVGVDSVDTTVARIVTAGGSVHMAAMTVPHVGRIAMVADPHGASLYVMTQLGVGPAASFAPGKPGHGGWHELHTTNAEAALAFYGDMFGWRKVREMDMGSMGMYLQFNCGSGEAVGGMMTDRNIRRPSWLYVFNVDEIDPACDRVKANGGEALTDPQRVPSGAWVCHVRDPQGAVFALVGPRSKGE